jgi:hypothetical protein
MPVPRLVVSGLLFALLSGVCFGQAPFDFDKAEYLKPAAAGSKKGETVGGTLRFDSGKKEVEFLDKKGTADVDVKYDSIKSILYEKTSKPRYAAGLLLAWPLLFTKSKKHYLTIQYTDAAGTGAFAIIHLDKSNFREAIARAESETGKKVERSEEH